MSHRSRKTSQSFFGLLLCLGSIDLLGGLSQRFSVLLLHLAQRIPQGIEDTKAHAASGKKLLIASSSPGRTSVRKIRALWTPPCLRSLGTSFQSEALSPSAPKSQKTEGLPSRIGLDPESHIHGFLDCFPSTNREKGPIQKTPHRTPQSGAFPARVSLILG